LWKDICDNVGFVNDDVLDVNTMVVVTTDVNTRIVSITNVGRLEVDTVVIETMDVLTMTVSLTLVEGPLVQRMLV
jgi:hypothetical protein